MPLISIVMPAYNAERFIVKAIESVIAQTYKDWELIIVDDGSTDKTSLIIKDFMIKDSRVKYYYQTNKKQAAARNLGISHCTGEWVAFFDADDFWEPAKLESQKKYTDTVDADIFFTSGIAIDENDQFLFNLPYPVGRFEGREIYKMLYSKNVIAIISVLMKLDFIKKAGAFDEGQYTGQWCEDWDYWIRLSNIEATFFGIDEKLFKYRINPGSTSRDTIRMNLGQALILIKNFEEERFDKKETRRIFKPLIFPLLVSLIKNNKSREVLFLLKNLSDNIPMFSYKLYYLMYRTLINHSLLPLKAVNKLDTLINYR